MSARPIGEIIKPIIARAEAMHGFQMMLNAMPTPEARKIMIVTAWAAGGIEDDDARLLIEAYGLETA